MSAATRSIGISQQSLDETLDCYLPTVRYLRSARVTHAEKGSGFDSEMGSSLALAQGEFASRAPWYIRDTGHFNAIEFNLCYNQLAFVLVRQSVESELDATLSEFIPKQDFLARMLPALVILRYSVTFERAMQAACFSGLLSLSKVVKKMGRLFLHTRFWVGPGDGTWCARGEVALAVLRGMPATVDVNGGGRRGAALEASVQ